MLNDTLFLDLSPGTARLLIARKRHRHIHVLFAQEHALPSKMFVDDLPNPGPLAEFLVERMKTVRRHPQFAYFLLPDTACFLFTVTLQPQDPNMMGDAIAWESSQHIPFDIHQTTLDWNTVRTGPEGTRTEIAATRTTTATAYAQTAEAAHLIPVHLEPRSPALFRAFHAKEPVDPLLLIAINQTSTSLFHLSSNGIPLLSTIPTFSLERCVTILGQQLRLDRKDAISALATEGISATAKTNVIRTALQDELNALMQEVQRADDFLGTPSKAFFASSPEFPILGLQETIAEVLQKSASPVVRKPIQWHTDGNDNEKRKYTALLGAAHGLL